MIGVLRAGALGDTLLTVPALHALRSHHPGTPLHVIGNAGAWSTAAPLVDAIHSINQPPYSTLLTDPTARLPGQTSRFDLFILWSARGSEQGSEVPGVVRATPYPPPGRHAAAWLFDTLSLPVPASLLPANPLVLPTDECAAGAQTLSSLGLNRPVLLHPGAGAAWKRWPAERFGRLARALNAMGVPVGLIEGPADAEAVAATVHALDCPLPVLREPSLRRLAAIIAGAGAYVGNDSGVTHLAAMAGAPTVALFGPTDPACWAPLGNVRILRRCTTTPARQGQIRTCDDPGCVEAVTFDEVLDAVTEILREAC